MALTRFFVGRYTKTPDDGIETWQLDTDSGEMRRLHVHAGIKNPTYLALSPDGNHLYAAGEAGGDAAVMHALRIAADGSLSAIGSTATGGGGACHVAVHPDASELYGAGYGDGRFTVYPLTDGIPGPLRHAVNYSEVSVPDGAEVKSRAHQVAISPDKRFLYVCDLGRDTIWRHTLHDGRVLTTQAPTAIPLPDGSGPRHMVFHPTLPTAYALGEHNGHLMTFRYERDFGALTMTDDVSIIDPEFTGRPAAAAIHLHPNARVLYASGRGDPCIAAFSLDAAGKATLHSHVTDGVNWPRDFAFSPDGGWMVAGGEHAGTLTSYRLNATAGLPVDGKVVATAEAAKPVCILFG